MFWVRLVGLAHVGVGIWLVVCAAGLDSRRVGLQWLGSGWADKDSVSSNQVGLACSGIASCC